jgi:hypothetical protein
MLESLLGIEIRLHCTYMTFDPGAGVAAGHRISDGLQVQVGAEPSIGAGCRSICIAHI